MFRTKHNNVYEGCIVEACIYDDLYKYGKIFNKDTFGPVLHIKLPHMIYRDFRLYNIYNCDNRDEISRYKHKETIHPWVDIMVDLLDLTVGLHTYKLELVNSITGDTYYLYFTYTIQDDEPEKKYMYINR